MTDDNDLATFWLGVAAQLGRPVLFLLFPFIVGFVYLQAFMQELMDELARFFADAVEEWWGQGPLLCVPPLIAGVEFGIEVGILVSGLVVIVLQAYILGKVQSTDR